MPATQSQSTQVKPPKWPGRDWASVTRPCRVAAGDATCALIVALDVINLEEGSARARRNTSNAVQECRRCPDREDEEAGLVSAGAG